MKNMMFVLALALALIGCGTLQTDGMWDIFDIGFFLCAAAIVMLIVGSGRDFYSE